MSTLKQRLTDDVKAAMLAGDAPRVECLRGLKSAILYAEVAAGKREEGLGDAEIEALKRQFSISVDSVGDEKVFKPISDMTVEEVISTILGIIDKKSQKRE